MWYLLAVLHLNYVTENQASSECSNTNALSGSSSSCATISHPKFPAKVHEISDSSDDEVNHQWTRASLPKEWSSGRSSNTSVKTASTGSNSLKWTAFTDIVSVDNVKCDEEAPVIGQTSPVKLDCWEISDDDLPTLPRLPDLGVGSDRKARHSSVKASKREDARDVGSAAATATVGETHSFNDSDGDDMGQAALPPRVRNGPGIHL